MKTIDIGDAAAALSDYVRDASDEPLVVTDGGTPVAAMIRVSAADIETLRLGDSAEFLAIIERSRVQFRAGQSLSAEDARRELGLG